MLKMSRADLYNLVWSKPITEISKQYGVRDQHVARVCDAYDIARPIAGHWSRVWHRKAVERVALNNNQYPPGEIVVVESVEKSIQSVRPRDDV
jgi:abortive infection bacteriophage resistance protein